MKTINESFTDQEFAELLKAKGKLNWHDFLLTRCLNDGFILVDIYCSKCKSIIPVNHELVAKAIEEEVKTK